MPQRSRVTLTWRKLQEPTLLKATLPNLLSPVEGPSPQGFPQVNVYSTVLREQTSFAFRFLTDFNRSPLWFEGDKHHHVSPSAFHTVSTVSTRLT